MMRRTLQTFGWLLLALGSSAQLGAQGRFDLEKTRTIVSGLVQKTLAENGIPSMSIALVRGDSIVWAAAFGYANVQTKTLATPETYYSTGSSFKSATATAIMQLVDQGKIRLDDPINRHLGDHRVMDRIQSEKPVTFTHILSHWSGLRAGAETKPIWGRTLPKTLEAMTSSLYSIRAPEARYEYNNFAYGMAGLLVEKISGVEYEKYIVENILRPIGVTTPHPVYPSPEMVETMALPYNAGGSHGTPRPEVQVHFDVYPAGDIYLTASDMARFLGAHINGGVFNGKRILSAESIKAMHEPRFGSNYGFGFTVTKDSATGNTLINHGGAIPGQRAFMIGDVDAKVGLYYMTNSDFLPDSPTRYSELVEAALRLLRGQDPLPRAEKKGIAVDDRTLNRYVGTYELENGTITIGRVGKALVFQQGDGPAKHELLAETPTRFFRRNSTAIVTFEGDGGAIDRLVLDTGNQRRTAIRRR